MAGNIDRIFQERYEPTNQQLILDYSKAFISFSNSDESVNSQYIYRGNEKIQFKERHRKYQYIFIAEFLEGNKNLLECSAQKLLNPMNIS